VPNLKTKNMNFIQKLFKRRKVDEPMNSALNIPVVIPRLSSEWVKFEDEKPPHEVVLAACDTYDCGWTMDTVWWYEDKQCWMTTCAVESTEAHLPYTHWRKLPPFPNEV
jgi:hypothetical protein